MKTSLDAERKHDILLCIFLIIRIFLTDQPFQFCLQTVTKAGFFCSGKQKIDQCVIGNQCHIKISGKHIRIFKRRILLAGDILEHSYNGFGFHLIRQSINIFIMAVKC